MLALINVSVACVVDPIERIWKGKMVQPSSNLSKSSCHIFLKV
jgi:hypothetical protein